MRAVPLYVSLNGKLCALARKHPPYRDTSLVELPLPPGFYSRLIPRTLPWSWGGGKVSHERGIPLISSARVSVKICNINGGSQFSSILVTG